MLVLFSPNSWTGVWTQHILDCYLMPGILFCQGRCHIHADRHFEHHTSSKHLYLVWWGWLADSACSLYFQYRQPCFICRLVLVRRVELFEIFGDLVQCWPYFVQSIRVRGVPSRFSSLRLKVILPPTNHWQNSRKPYWRSVCGCSTRWYSLGSIMPAHCWLKFRSHLCIGANLCKMMQQWW